MVYQISWTWGRHQGHFLWLFWKTLRPSDHNACGTGLSASLLTECSLEMHWRSLQHLRSRCLPGSSLCRGAAHSLGLAWKCLPLPGGSAHAEQKQRQTLGKRSVGRFPRLKFKEMCVRKTKATFNTSTRHYRFHHHIIIPSLVSFISAAYCFMHRDVKHSISDHFLQKLIIIWYGKQGM